MRRLLRATGIVVALAVVVAIAVAGWFWHAVYRDRSMPAAATQLVVPRGATFAEVARELAAGGVIDDVATFRVLARLRREEADVRAGEYRFAAHQTQSEILRALISGGAQVAVWVTIPEGFTAAQIAQRLGENGVGDSAAFPEAHLLDIGG